MSVQLCILNSIVANVDAFKDDLGNRFHPFTLSIAYSTDKLDVTDEDHEHKNLYDVTAS